MIKPANISTALANTQRLVPLALNLIEPFKEQCSAPEIKKLLPTEPTPALEARAQRFSSVNLQGTHIEELARLFAMNVARLHPQNPAWQIHALVSHPASSLEKHFPLGLEVDIRTENPENLLSSRCFLERMARAYSAHHAMQVVTQKAANDFSEAGGWNAGHSAHPRGAALAWLETLRSPVVDHSPSTLLDLVRPSYHWERRMENSQLGSQAINLQNPLLSEYDDISEAMRNIYAMQLGLAGNDRGRVANTRA